MKGMTLICALIVACAAIYVGSAGAATVTLPGDTGQAVEVRTLESDGFATVLEYKLGRFNRNLIEIEENTYNQVSLGDESNMLLRGFPDLPNVCRSIIVPGDAEMEVRVISSNFVEFMDTPIAPSKGTISREIDPATGPYSFDSIYRTRDWYPSDLVTGLDPYIIRDFRGMVVVLNPFQYNPATRVLRVYHHIVVEVSPVGPSGANVLMHGPTDEMNAEFHRIYERHFVNFDAVMSQRYALIGEVGSMLVISHDDFASSMEPFVEWKKQMGIPCEMVSVTDAGGDSTGLKTYIQDYYDANGVVFVLLVGDADQVPSCTHLGRASDVRYALTSGADLYPDVFIGRFSAETTAHAETQVLRSVEYERDPQAGADWYHGGTGIASDQGPGDDGEMDYEHMGFIRDDLLAFTYTVVDETYDPGAVADDVTTAVNAGRSIINYVGHGGTTGWSTSGFSNADVNALTNDNELPFIFSVACHVGNFDGNTCFAEAWLRATNGTEPSGAVAAYMSTIGQPWSQPMDAQDEMNDLLVGGVMRTFGALCFNGSCHMLDEYPDSDADKTVMTWTIFGDPSLRVRTDTPADMTVTHEDWIDPYALWFDVSVSSVEGALCALYHDGVLFGSAFTDVAGNVSIPVVGELPQGMNLLLTVTAFNKMTYVGEVYVRYPEYCTLTQGFYGNEGGDFNGVPTLDILDDLITGADPLTVGTGCRSLTFGEGSEDCVITLLPALGPPQTLPEGFGAATIDAMSCQTTPVALPTKNGRVRNILLGQILTLSLNVRLDDRLPDLPICCQLVTQEALCGPDGICGNEDDEPDPDGEIRTLSIGDSVLDALTAAGLDLNVEGLLELANRALAGMDVGYVTLGEMTNAVDVINTAFDGCRFIIDCTDCPPGSKTILTELLEGSGDCADWPVAKDGRPTSFALAGNAPNPVREGTVITYALPERSAVRLAIYNLRGQLVSVLEDGVIGAGHHAVRWDAAVGSGVYFYRFVATGLESGDGLKRIGKMMVVK